MIRVVRRWAGRLAARVLRRDRRPPQPDPAAILAAWGGPYPLRSFTRDGLHVRFGEWADHTAVDRPLP